MSRIELNRKSLLLIVACAVLATSLAAQSTPPPTHTISFDVATIKPHEGMVSITGLINRPDGIRAIAATVSEMVTFAYGMRSEDQVSGGPGWTKSDRYDIEAKMGAEDAAEFQKLSSKEMSERRAQMLRALLDDRFKFKSHLVNKDVPVYELVVAKSSPKLRDAATDSDQHLRMGSDGKPLAGLMQFSPNGGSTAQGYTMGELASQLSQPFAGLGRPVIDKTGLTGTYNFTLDWKPQLKAPSGGGPAIVSAPSDDAPSIFTALQELGLKLQPATGPAKYIVIDHVERPSAN